MTQVDAIIWVLGGAISIFATYVSVKNFVEKRDAKLIAQAKQDAKDERDLDANWKETRDIKSQVEAITKLAEATNKAVRALIDTRNGNIKKEELKYYATKTLTKFHMADDPIFVDLNKKFEEIEKEERKALNAPVETPDTFLKEE